MSTRFSLSMAMSRLTRGWTTEPVSRDQKFSGAYGDREILFFPVQLTRSSIGNLITRLILTLAICDDGTYIHTYIHTHIHRDRESLEEGESKRTTTTQVWNIIQKVPESVTLLELCSRMERVLLIVNMKWWEARPVRENTKIT